MSGVTCRIGKRTPLGHPEPRPRPAARRHWQVVLPLLAALLHATGASAEAWTEFEEGIGKLTFNELKSRQGMVEDPLLLEWVRRVGGAVAAQSSRRYLDYRFYILDTNERNAFALPGGYVIVTLGLLGHVNSDEQLAGVIAHEVAHSDDRDFARLLREQLVLLGVQGALRGRVDDGWVLASQFMGVLVALRSSRRHEAQADYNGARLCLRAAYDPGGLVDFLDTLTPQQSGLDSVFATHPSGNSRVEATRLRVRELESVDYAGLIGVARSLSARRHLTLAARFAALAVERFPREPEPPLLLGAIEEERGNLPAARVAYEQAAARGAGATAPREALQRLQPVSSPPLVPVTLPAAVQAQVQANVTELRADEKQLYQAEQALRARLKGFYDDRQIATALQAAQLISPELRDEAYLTTLARASRVLSRANQEAMRQGEVMARGAAVRLVWERIAAGLTANKESLSATENTVAGQVAELESAGGLFLTEARPAVQAVAVAVEDSARRCGELTVATRMLSAAFLALVASGPDQPLGRINFARFLLLQGEIAAAEGRIRRSEQASDKALRAVVEQHARAMQVALTTLHATAAPALRELDLALVAQRVDATAAAVRTATEGRPLGEAAAALLDQRVPAKARAGLQVKDCLLRIAYLDLAAERP